VPTGKARIFGKRLTQGRKEEPFSRIPWKIQAFPLAEEGGNSSPIGEGGEGDVPEKDVRLKGRLILGISE